MSDYLPNVVRPVPRPCYGPLISRAQENGDHNTWAQLGLGPAAAKRQPSGALATLIVAGGAAAGSQLETNDYVTFITGMRGFSVFSITVSTFPCNRSCILLNQHILARAAENSDGRLCTVHTHSVPSGPGRAQREPWPEGFAIC